MNTSHLDVHSGTNLHRVRRFKHRVHAPPRKPPTKATHESRVFQYFYSHETRILQCTSWYLVKMVPKMDQRSVPTVNQRMVPTVNQINFIRRLNQRVYRRPNDKDDGLHGTQALLLVLGGRNESHRTYSYGMAWCGIERTALTNCCWFWYCWYCCWARKCCCWCCCGVKCDAYGFPGGGGARRRMVR